MTGLIALSSITTLLALSAVNGFGFGYNHGGSIGLNAGGKGFSIGSNEGGGVSLGGLGLTAGFKAKDHSHAIAEASSVPSATGAILTGRYGGALHANAYAASSSTAAQPSGSYISVLKNGYGNRGFTGLSAGLDGLSGFIGAVHESNADAASTADQTSGSCVDKSIADSLGHIGISGHIGAGLGTGSSAGEYGEKGNARVSAGLGSISEAGDVKGLSAGEYGDKGSAGLSFGLGGLSGHIGATHGTTSFAGGYGKKGSAGESGDIGSSLGDMGAGHGKGSSAGGYGDKGSAGFSAGLSGFSGHVGAGLGSGSSAGGYGEKGSIGHFGGLGSLIGDIGAGHGKGSSAGGYGDKGSGGLSVGLDGLSGHIGAEREENVAASASATASKGDIGLDYAGGYSSKAKESYSSGSYKSQTSSISARLSPLTESI